MTDNDFNKFGEIVDKKLNHALEPIKETLQDQTRRLEALAGDIEQLHMDVKGIRDQIGLGHTRNKREIDEIKTHLKLPLIPDTPQI